MQTSSQQFTAATADRDRSVGHGCFELLNLSVEGTEIYRLVNFLASLKSCRNCSNSDRTFRLFAVCCLVLGDGSQASHNAVTE